MKKTKVDAVLISFGLVVSDYATKENVPREINKYNLHKIIYLWIINLFHP